MFYPHGGVPYYWPAAPGVGDGWQLSSILEPLAPLKAKLAVLGGVSNYAPWGKHIEPAHGNVCAATWTCVKANGPAAESSGTSVDQVIAKTIGGATPLSSLQVGLSTLDSYPDGHPGQHSRSISWSDPATPLYKMISPQAVFDRLVGDTTRAPSATSNKGGIVDPMAERRRQLRKSALDYLADSTASLRTRVSRSDGVRLDRFLSSVRSIEQRVAAPAMQLGSSTCALLPRPTEVYSVEPVHDDGPRAIRGRRAAARLRPRPPRRSHDRSHRHGASSAT